MEKPTIVKIWLAGLVGLAVGFIVAAAGIAVMLAFGGTWTKAAATSGNSYDFVPRYDAVFWSMVGLAAVGGAVALAGAITQFVAWIGALVNTFQLPSKAWFVVLLLTGLIGHVVGLAAMLVYLVAGPDATQLERQPVTTPRPWPASAAPIT